MRKLWEVRTSEKRETAAWPPERFIFNDILIVVSAWSLTCQIQKGTAV